MYLITPGLGIIFWQTVSFVCVLFLLKKFAWKPILSVIKNREAAIAKATRSLEIAVSEAEKIGLANEEALKSVSLQSDKIIKDALEAKREILEAAKGESERIGDELLNKARMEIKRERHMAIADLRSYFVSTSVKMAEMLVKKEITSTVDQEYLLDKMLKEVK
jgi:F-type H+-transporting ATPase subunit b